MPQPLAVRMRPETVDEIAGQTHILYPGSLLDKMIRTDTLQSIILYGPPGTGKTTIARVVANTTKAAFERINAVQAGKKDIEAVCSKARKAVDGGGRTTLFIDEIHRFNKAQQDYLLPFVEEGVVTLIGATTENPYFEVNPALVSRSIIFNLKPVTAEEMKPVIRRALSDPDRGLGSRNLSLEPEAETMIAEQANGDVRNALSVLEMAALNADGDTVSVDNVKAVIQKPHLQYDKDGDMHYDTISAFIKSMRGSDPDAVLYYLARMIESGEDPKFIARRIMIHACEDVGAADPMAIVVATAVSLCVERIGMPEGRIPLAMAATYIAMAPKSNAAAAGIDAALDYVKRHPSNDVPDHLRDAHYKSAKKLGHGVDYKYPHDFPGHWVDQQYLPDSVREFFYKNFHMGYEAAQAKYLNELRVAASKPAEPSQERRT